MKKCIPLGLVLLVSMLVPRVLVAQQAEVDAAKLADIRQYLELTGYKQSMLDGLSEVIEASRQNPDIPQKFWDGFEQRFVDRIDELLARIALVYSDYFTHDEIRRILAFYRTDTGAKLVRSKADISQRITEISERFGAEIGEEVGAEMGGWSDGQ